MTRVRRGYTAQRHRTKMRLFTSSFRGAHSRLIQTITQQNMRAFVSAYRDRGRQKRDFRCLWITRINAVTRENEVSYSYSRLIHNLYKRQLLLNRKIPAQIAILNKNCLCIISKRIIKKDYQIKEIIKLYTGKEWLKSNSPENKINSGKIE
uniref:ribosomal protein L20 n=1 Tax=Amorphophallus muelleri TaxID=175741 RepID=UPI003001DF38|nr:ribosomal protein L20 [Amorphophallus muelleri]